LCCFFRFHYRFSSFRDFFGSKRAKLVNKKALWDCFRSKKKTREKVECFFFVEKKTELSYSTLSRKKKLRIVKITSLVCVCVCVVSK
jgi:hypothetical protein